VARKQQRRGREQRKRERRGEEERETGTGSALEIWTPGGVTVTRRETGEMGTEWNERARRGRDSCSLTAEARTGSRP
jgi:hypothetical protein